MNATPELVNGSFYDKQYMDTDSEYYKLYIDPGINQRAEEINDGYIDFAIWAFDLPPGAKVLEAGCGVGHKIRCWNRRGFECTGLEVSKYAKRLSPFRGQIVVGNVSDLSGFHNDQFDLIFSHGMLEHIPEEVLDKTLSGFARVATRQFHIISTEEGVDPGHITVMDHLGWLTRVAKSVEGTATCVMNLPDFIMQEEREAIIVVGHWGLLPFPMKKRVSKYAQKAMEAQENIQKEKAK